MTGKQSTTWNTSLQKYCSSSSGHHSLQMHYIRKYTDLFSYKLASQMWLSPFCILMWLYITKIKKWINRFIMYKTLVCFFVLHVCDVCVGHTSEVFILCIVFVLHECKWCWCMIFTPTPLVTMALHILNCRCGRLLPHIMNCSWE
jgi:hypothetical protein